MKNKKHFFSRKSRSQDTGASPRSADGALRPEIPIESTHSPNVSLTFESLLQTNAELQRVNRALRIVSACNQALVRASVEATLFNEICRAVVELGGYRMAWVGYGEHDARKSIRHAAHFGVGRLYLQSAQVSWDETDRRSGPTGTAIRTGMPVVMRHIAAGSGEETWRTEMTQHGYASSIALPLRVNEVVVGALTIYSSDADAFEDDEVRVLTVAADDLSFGLTTMRTRAEQVNLRSALRQSEDWLQVAVRGSLDALLLLTPILNRSGAPIDFTVTDVNSRTEELVKLPRSKLVGRPFSKVFYSYYKEVLPRYLLALESGKPTAETFALTSPTGQIIWVHHQILPIAQGLAVVWRDITKAIEDSQKLEASQKNYRELLESLQEGIWAADSEGRTTFVNAPMAEMLGCTVDEVLGKSLFDFIEEHLHESFRQHFARREQGARERYEFEFRRKDGTPIFLDIEAAPRFDSARKVVGRIAGVMDITARKQTEKRLRASLLTLAKAENLAHVGTWSYLRGNRTYNLSDEMLRILGLPSGTHRLSNEAVIGLFHPEDRIGAMEDLRAMLAGQQLRNERRIVRPDGAERVLHFQSESILDDAGRVTQVDGFAQDVTERKHDEAQLEYLATHDALTALPNRRVLEDRLDHALAQLKRHPQKSLAVLYLDLDRFKFVNDSLGHAAGDELLKQAAKTLRSTVRTEDTVARQGGDEFIVLLQDIRQPSDVILVAEKIQTAFAKPFSIQGRDLYATFSIGASMCPDDGQDIETLLKNADAAMYRAKQSGSRIQFYTRALSQQATERVQLENDLRRALQKEEFELYYQPQVTLPTGRIVGAEALIRWHHPTEGLVQPYRFIPLAEETGLIEALGEWVLSAACKQYRSWRSQGLPAICIAVNVAASQFLTGRIEALIATMAGDCQTTEGCLELELTERVVMQNAEGAIDRLQRLKGYGVHVSIDDFGTGYSSLAYFRRLPIDKIKIAQSFVRDIEVSEDARTLVRVIINLARAFGFTVLAEGVETAAQARFVAQHGCQEAQGFYFAQPMPASQFEEILRDARSTLPAPDISAIQRELHRKADYR